LKILCVWIFGLKNHSLLTFLFSTSKGNWFTTWCSTLFYTPMVKFLFFKHFFSYNFQCLIWIIFAYSSHFMTISNFYKKSKFYDFRKACDLIYKNTWWKFSIIYSDQMEYKMWRISKFECMVIGYIFSGFSPFKKNWLFSINGDIIF